MQKQRVEKVPVPQSRRLSEHQNRSGPAEVILWSQSLRSARRWENRLACLGSPPTDVVTCRTILQGLRSGGWGEGPVLLADFEVPPSEGAAPALRLGRKGWALLRSCLLVAVVRETTWSEAGPWLLHGAGAVVAWESTDEEVRAALDAVRAGHPAQMDDLLRKTMRGPGLGQPARPGAPSNSLHHAPWAGRPPGGPEPTKLSPQTKLSPRQREVLLLMCRDLSSLEIAQRLSVSEANVRYHLNSLYRKLGVSSRLHAVLIALSNGWVALDDLLEDLKGQG